MRGKADNEEVIGGARRWKQLANVLLITSNYHITERASVKSPVKLPVGSMRLNKRHREATLRYDIIATLVIILANHLI